MDIYSRIYYTLCNNRSQLKESWHPGSNLHRHHIIPKHSNGTDDDSNYTYLTVREHIIAHFLLWKIHKNPNDLRAMKMLGAKLTSKQRRTVGLWCKENKIGIHGATKEDIRSWQQKGLNTQKTSNNKNSFYYWYTSEGRRCRASMGGKIGGKKQYEQGLGFHNSEIRKIATSLGGKSHIGKKWMYKPGENKNFRILPEKIDDMLNKGYVFGMFNTSSYI